MSLKNAQYDRIMREYYRRQLDHKRQQDERVKAAYQSLPQLAKIDGKIASLSVGHARALLEGTEHSPSDLRAEITKLAEIRRKILTEHGYPADYLELHYTCPDCKDTGYIGSEKCHCFKQAVIDLLYTQSNIRQILQEENFDTFCFDYYSDQTPDSATGMTPLANIRRIVGECKEFIRNFDLKSQNFFFYGDTGVGKTFLSHCISRDLIESAHSVIYFTAFELFDLFSKTTFRRDEGDEELRRMHSYIFDCDLLIIDDLGTELTNAFVASQLFLCINERILQKKSTIISTNLDMNAFRDTYTERVFSRISSHYTMRKLLGDDIRILKKLKGIKP